MGKFFRVRKPRLRVSKRGKVSFSGGGLSIGGKTGRVNISKSGVSTSFGVPGLRYNSRRGWSFGGRRQARRSQGCGCMVLLVLGITGTAVGVVGASFVSLLS